MTPSVKVVAVTGPTATGKTALAVKIARAFHGEIVSVDSRQVYRGMDLGTGKDLAEYAENGTPVPYHLIDIVSPLEEYHLARFLPDAFAAVAAIAGRGRLPILCGGSALYLAALLGSYRLPGGARAPGAPRGERRADEPPSFTPPFRLDALTLGVYFPREEVRKRIEARLDARLSAGLVEEVARLHREGVSFEKLEFFGLEYREIARYLQGEIDFDAMRNELLNRIRQFAKRQDIFFRKMEREGHRIYWLKNPEPETLIKAFLSGGELPEPELRMSDMHYGKKQPRKEQ